MEHVGAASIGRMAAGFCEIDGSVGEGGGQIVRIAVALAAITGHTVRVKHIRPNRKSPGLKPQHLCGLKLVAQLCSGTLDGAAVGSTDITLRPRQLAAGAFTADVQTAGSCMLLAQAAVPCALLAAHQPATDTSGVDDVALADTRSETLLDLKGGTDAAMAPSFSYTQLVVLPTLRRLLQVSIEAECTRRGFFPQGGGNVRVGLTSLAHNTCLPPVQLIEKGEITEITIEAIACGRMNIEIAERMAVAAQKTLETADHALRAVPVTVNVRSPEAQGNGGSVIIIAKTSTGCLFGGSALAERGKTSEQVGQSAAEELLEGLAHGGCVDEWLQDQLIIFMAVAQGHSVVTCGEPTLHTRTAMMVCEVLTSAKFAIKQLPSSVWEISCIGAGIKAGLTVET